MTITGDCGVKDGRFEGGGPVRNTFPYHAEVRASALWTVGNGTKVLAGRTVGSAEDMNDAWATQRPPSAPMTILNKRRSVSQGMSPPPHAEVTH